MADKKTTTKAASAKSKNQAFADLTALSRNDLAKKASELREEITTLQRGMHNGEVQNVRAAGAKKRELARVLTALTVVSSKENK